MAYLVTFDTIDLINPEPFDRGDNVLTGITLLLSGKQSTQTSTETTLSISFRCQTETYSDISNLRAKIGLKKTLTINGTDFLKCSISGKFIENEWAPGKWKYAVGFIQDTT